MTLPSCLGSLTILVLISLGTVLAKPMTCEVCGDPHFEGWNPEMNGSVSFPCNYLMLATEDFDIYKDGDAASVTVGVGNAVAPLRGRYYVHGIEVLIRAKDVTTGTYKAFMYQTSITFIEQAMAGERADPWTQAQPTPLEYANKLVTNFSSTADTGTANLYVFNIQDQVAFELHFHKYQTWTCLKTKVDSSIQMKTWTKFPKTLCSTYGDTTWGGMDTTGLTNQQIILYGLCKQPNWQTNADCKTAEQILLQKCASDAARKDAVKSCDHFLNPDEAQCLEDSARGGESGDAFRAFYLCMQAQGDCGGETTPVYQELLGRGCP